MEDNALKKSASPRELVLAILMCIALFGAFLRLIYNPKTQAIEEISTKVKSTITEEKGLQQQVELLAKQKQKKEENQVPVVGSPKIQILNGALKPEISDIAPLIETISSTEFVQGLAIDSISYKAEVKKASHQEIPIQIKAHGTFNKLHGFLKNLGDLNVLFSVDSVNISTDSNLKGEMEIEVEATFYIVEGIHADEKTNS